MGNCESLASKAFTSDSKGLAGGALGAATTGAGSGGATLWQRAACKPENAHTRTRTKIRRVNDCLVERKTIRPMKSVNSNFHFNGKRAVLLAPSTGQCQVKSKGLCGPGREPFLSSRLSEELLRSRAQTLKPIFFTGQHWTSQPDVQNPVGFFNTCY